MKTLVLLSVLSLAALSGCDKQPSLKSVADRVPVKLVCGTHTDEELAAVLKRYVADPEGVTKELAAGIANPDTALQTTCLLVDGKAYLERTGQRLTEAYKQTKQALSDLGL